ncbi:hypothetical protein SD436_05375 [Streptococcus sp. 2A/TPW/M5]
MAEEQEGQLNTPAIVAKEESQAVNPKASQDKDSAAALPTDKVSIETSSQEQPIPDKSPEIAPSQTPTKPVSDPTPEKEAVEKKEQQDQSIPEANPVEKRKHGRNCGR